MFYRQTNLVSFAARQMHGSFMLSAVTVILVILVLCGDAGAYPTTSGQVAVAFNSAGFSIKKPSSTNALASSEAILAGLGKEILKPSLGPAITSDHSRAGIKILPATPASVFTLLIGFLCVSLVRDRKVWLTVLALIFSTGQSGISAVPKLARHFHQQYRVCRIFTKMVGPRFYVNDRRGRCDIEGSRYIALLNYLDGIPEHPHSDQTNFHLQASRTFTPNKSRSIHYCFAIISPRSNFIGSSHSPAVIAEQCFCFSKELTLEIKPRAPPLPAVETVFLT